MEAPEVCSAQRGDDARVTHVHGGVGGAFAAPPPPLGPLFPDPLLQCCLRDVLTYVRAALLLVTLF